jgi:hypothetical protein
MGKIVPGILAFASTPKVLRKPAQGRDEGATLSNPSTAPSTLKRFSHLIFGHAVPLISDL